MTCKEDFLSVLLTLLTECSRSLEGRVPSAGPQGDTGCVCHYSGP